MAVHKWRRRPTKYFGDVWVAFTQIELQATNGHFQAFALQLDSGAVVSLLRRSVADLLGINLETGRRVELASVGGTGTIAYVHEIPTRFAENIAFRVPFAIADTETVPNLLGRLRVFDQLQFDFDGTLEETRIAAPWLDPGQRRIWEFLNATEQHILARWAEMELPDPGRKVACRFIERAGQILASAAGLSKLDRCYAAPALIRALFELALQFEYFLSDPASCAQQYLDFTHIARHERAKANTKNPTGLISQQRASSPLRMEGEKRNRAEYDRVRPQFLIKPKRLARNWYCMSIRDLADKLGRLGEYRLVYTWCSAWAHGDPLSTQLGASDEFCKPKVVFTLCSSYYARMLLQMADVAKVLLTAEQYDGLREWAKGVS